MIALLGAGVPGINVSKAGSGLGGPVQTQITIHSESYSIIHTGSFQFYLPRSTLGLGFLLQ